MTPLKPTAVFVAHAPRRAASTLVSSHGAQIPALTRGMGTDNPVA